MPARSSWYGASIDMMMKEDDLTEKKQDLWDTNYLDGAFSHVGRSGTFFTERPFLASVGKRETQAMLFLKAMFLCNLSWRNWGMLVFRGVCHPPTWQSYTSFVCREGDLATALACCGSNRDLIMLFTTVLCNLILVVGLLIAIAFSVVGKRVRAKQVVIGTYFTSAVFNGGCFIFGVNEDTRALAVKQCVGCLIFPSILLYDEELLVRGLFVNGVYDILCVVHDYIHQEVSTYMFCSYGGGLSHLAFAFKIALDRYINIRRSREIVRQDMVYYDALWVQVLAEEKSAVLSLRATVQRIQQTYLSRQARQYRRKPRGSSKLQTVDDDDDEAESPEIESLMREMSNKTVGNLEELKELEREASGGSDYQAITIGAPARAPVSASNPNGSFFSSSNATPTRSPVRSPMRSPAAGSPDAIDKLSFMQHPRLTFSPLLPAGAMHAPMNMTPLGSMDRPSAGGKHYPTSALPPRKPRARDVAEAARTRALSFRRIGTALGRSLDVFRGTFEAYVRKGPSPDDDLDYSCPINKISKLFVAAHCTHEPLVALASRLAKDSEGSFPVMSPAGASSDGSDEYVKWKDAPEGTVFKFAAVKKASRAIEKCWRVYSGDPSRLLDICRQAIVFETVDDLAWCLQLIEDDPGVVVVRVKNRMDPNHSSWESCGYRDVLVNLRIVNQDSIERRVHHHVVELQLLLINFAKLKTSDGHRRYIESRNKKGE